MPSKVIPNRSTTNCAHSEFGWCWSNPLYPDIVRRNVTRPDRLLPVYDSVRARIKGVMRKGVEAAMPPNGRSSTMVEAATDSAPRRRYTAGKKARQVRFLRRFVPESMVDKSLRKMNELPV